MIPIIPLLVIGVVTGVVGVVVHKAAVREKARITRGLQQPVHYSAYEALMRHDIQRAAEAREAEIRG